MATANAYRFQIDSTTGCDRSRGNRGVFRQNRFHTEDPLGIYICITISAYCTLYAFSYASSRAFRVEGSQRGSNESPAIKNESQENGCHASGPQSHRGIPAESVHRDGEGDDGALDE